MRFAKVDDGFSVTLAGNGPLLAATVEEAKDLPPRVLLDFHGVAAGSAPAVTNVKNDDVDRIRVATNSRSPLITRVVIDLARKLPYTVEQIGEDLRVMFSAPMAAHGRDAGRGVVAPAAAENTAAPVKIEEPVVKAPVAETVGDRRMCSRSCDRAVAAPAASTASSRRLRLTPRRFRRRLPHRR